jgi:hypothetical protein
MRPSLVMSRGSGLRHEFDVKECGALCHLFRVGRRTQYWIIYTVDEETRPVDILLLWNAARDPRTLDL